MRQSKNKNQGACLILGGSLTYTHGNILIQLYLNVKINVINQLNFAEKTYNNDNTKKPVI